jgi:hypothetical protein
MTIDADPQQTTRLAGVANATTVTDLDFLSSVMPPAYRQRPAPGPFLGPGSKANPAR